MRKFTLNDLKKKELPSTPVNNVLFVLDRSGSMQSLRRKVTEETNRRIEEMRQYDLTYNMETRISILEFSDSTKWAVKDTHVSVANYAPVRISENMTALAEACYEGIKYLKTLPPRSKDESFLVLILTDGGENQSSPAAVKNLPKAIKSLPENWTVTYIGPGSGWAIANGIPAENCLLWSGAANDYVRTAQAQSVGTQSYYLARSTGASAVQSFYTVDPNKIQSYELSFLNKLNANEFKLLQNWEPKIELKPFLEKNNLQFKRGVSYYQLLKPEKIQEDKDLLILDNSTGEVYGKGNHGRDIRRFLGIPETGVVNVRPKKGDKYTIFVQSNSNNRKLISWKDKTTGEKVAQSVIVLL